MAERILLFPVVPFHITKQIPGTVKTTSVKTTNGKGGAFLSFICCISMTVRSTR